MVGLPDHGEARFELDLENGVKVLRLRHDVDDLNKTLAQVGLEDLRDLRYVQQESTTRDVAMTKIRDRAWQQE